MSQTKHCRGCNRDLPLDAFPADPTRADGRQYRCRVCVRARNPNAKPMDSFTGLTYGPFPLPSVNLASSFRRSAGRLGLSVDEVMRRFYEGDKWCPGCRAWRQRHQFARSLVLWDGVSPKCIDCTKARISLTLAAA